MATTTETPVFKTCFRIFLVLTSLSLLPACQPEQAKSGATTATYTSTTQTTPEVSTVHLNEQATELDFSTPGSALYGVHLSLPAHALATPIELSLSMQADLPGAIPEEAQRAGARQLSQVIRLQSSEPILFATPLVISLPYQSKAVTPEQQPVVVRWEAQTQSYSPVAVHSIKPEQGILSFSTAHDGDYVVMYIDLLKQN